MPARALGPSPHLTWEELACHDAARTPYPLIWRADRAVWLALEFEAIRALCGHQPLLVTSGYRTPAWNRAIKGARASQHLEGRALDLVPTRPVTIEELFRHAIARAHTPGSRVRFIQCYSGWVHMDIRPISRVIVKDLR